jgi:hypothetical protein
MGGTYSIRPDAAGFMACEGYAISCDPSPTARHSRLTSPQGCRHRSISSTTGGHDEPA